MDTGNSRRFIKAYNQIDSALRIQGDMKRSISYTEAIRKAARTNSLVAKYEDQLIDFGRLRNAIVHNSNPDLVIAEPHDDVVEEYERDNPDKEKLNRSIRKRRFLHHSHDFHKRNRVSFT